MSVGGSQVEGDLTQVGSSIEPAQPPNWKTVRKMVLELLERTRDLRLLVELARTELNLSGLIAFRDAVALLRKSIEQYWDSVHPQLDPEDDNDPTLRVNILVTVCDMESFLRPLINAPLVDSRTAGRFSLRDVQFATGKTTPPPGQVAPQLSMIEGAFSDVPPETVAATHEALKDSLSDINGLENFLTQQIGVGNAPSFAPIRDVLKEALSFVGEHVKGEDSFNEEQVGADAFESAVDGSAKKTSAGQIGGINSRQDVIRALDLVCKYYKENEPSSPVPLLVLRAKRLVTMDFMEIIQDLAPDGVSQVEIFKGHDPEQE